MSNAAFAERLKQACASHPECPAFHQGRLTWIRKKLGERGTAISMESLSRWHSGDSRPRQDKCEKIADILGVPAEWLYMGSQVFQHKADSSIVPTANTAAKMVKDEDSPLFIKVRPGVRVSVLGLPADLNLAEAKRISNIVLAHATEG